MGENLGTLGGVDVRVGDLYYVECKSFTKWPSKWFEKAWSQAQFHCKLGHVPVLQLHKAGTHHLSDDLVLIPLTEFKRLLER